MVIETKKLILLLLIFLEDLLEVSSVLRLDDIPRSTIVAMSVNRCKWLDKDSLLLTNNSFVVIKSAAVIATKFILFNSYHNIIG